MSSMLRRPAFVFLQLASAVLVGCGSPRVTEDTTTRTTTAAVAAPTLPLEGDETLGSETLFVPSWNPLDPSTALAQAADAVLPGTAVIRLWSGDKSIHKLRILTKAEPRTNGNYPSRAYNKIVYPDEHNPNAVGARTYDYNYPRADSEGFLVANCVLRKIGGSWVLMSSTGNPAHCR